MFWPKSATSVVARVLTAATNKGMALEPVCILHRFLRAHECSRRRCHLAAPPSSCSQMKGKKPKKASQQQILRRPSHRAVFCFGSPSIDNAACPRYIIALMNPYQNTEHQSPSKALPNYIPNPTNLNPTQSYPSYPTLPYTATITKLTL